MLIEAVLAWPSKRGEIGKTVIGTGFCDAKYEGNRSYWDYDEKKHRELSYLFFETSNVEWVDGREFSVNDFDVVYTDTIKIIG